MSIMKNSQRRLRRYQQDYDRAKARIQRVGFICEGSLLERYLPCGNPTCSCHKDPSRLHGPYNQLSWKEKGKTVSRILSPDVARHYRGWVDNRRSLFAIVEDMRMISRKASQIFLAKERCKEGEAREAERKKSRRARKD